MGRQWYQRVCCRDGVGGGLLGGPHLPGGGPALPGAQLVRPRAPRRPLHRDTPASLHPHACHGRREVHDPDGDLQLPVCCLQPRLDNPPSSNPPTPLHPSSSNTSSRVDLLSCNKLSTMNHKK